MSSSSRKPGISSRRRTDAKQGERAGVSLPSTDMVRADEPQGKEMAMKYFDWIDATALVCVLAVMVILAVA